MAGAAVRVCTAAATGQPCAPLANIYSDAALTQALANPTTTDGMENYSFYAAPGRYMIEINGPGITTKQLPNVILPNDPSAPTFTSLTTTSGINAFSLSLSGNLTVTGSTAVTGALTVGGAAVPSTGQANTWSAAQTFNQDLIAGSKVPWTDVRAAGALCNNTNDDSTPMNATVSGMLTSGGTPLFPDNCKGSLTLPSPGKFINLSFGGRFNPTATMHVPNGYTLGCHDPTVQGQGTIPFTNVPTCLIATSLNPAVSLENNSGFNGLLQNISFYGSGVQLAENKSGNTAFRNVWSQASTDAGTPFQATNGFGYYFEAGGLLSASPTGQPSANFITTNNGGMGCDPPRMIEFNKTFLNMRGVNFDTHLCLTGGLTSSVRSVMQLYEGGADCMFCLDMTGTSFGGFDLYEPIVADTVGNGAAPVIRLLNTGHTLISSVIVNPGAVGPIFRQPPGTNTTGPALFDGAIELGCLESQCPLGIYGFNNSYFHVNKHGGLTTFANSASAAFGGGLKVPIFPPTYNTTPSASGGTFASGLVCWMVAGVDAGGNEGPPGGSVCSTLTGPTASESISLGFAPPGAVSYNIYRRIGGPIEDDTNSSTVRFTSALASPFVDTGAGGTAAAPVQVDNNPWYVAATDELNPNGPGWVGKGGPFGVGMVPVGGVAGDLQVAGKISATNWPLAASATLTYTAIAAQTCQEQSVTVTGAAGTGAASASPTASLGSVNLSWSAWVSAANTVSVRVCNPSAGSITPSAVAWQARVIQ